MTTASIRPHPSWAAVAAVLGAVAALVCGGCATQSGPVVAVQSIPMGLSPVEEAVAPREAWRLAEDYARAHPGCEVLLGSGDSMLPLYHDRTVLVIEPMAMSGLRAGMTVIFTGERGWPVAHTLLEKTPRGWRTMGLGNREPDRTMVRYDNYIGTVVKAFAPTARLAVAQAARAEED